MDAKAEPHRGEWEGNLVARVLVPSVFWSVVVRVDGLVFDEFACDELRQSGHFLLLRIPRKDFIAVPGRPDSRTATMTCGVSRDGSARVKSVGGDPR